jgi:hypothetical protein
LPTLQEQGAKVQEGLRNSLEILYENTLQTAKKAAAEVDTALKQQQ